MTIHEIKRSEITETPLLLFECELPTGAVERWSTHEIQLGELSFDGRVLRHNVFDLRSASEDGIDALSKVSLTLANADSYFSQVERAAGWKGSRLTVRFVFLNALSGEAVSEEMVIFRGACNPPDEITESAIRLSFVSRMNLQRICCQKRASSGAARGCFRQQRNSVTPRSMAATEGSTRRFIGADTRPGSKAEPATCLEDSHTPTVTTHDHHVSTEVCSTLTSQILQHGDSVASSLFLLPFRLRPTARRLLTSAAPSKMKVATTTLSPWSTVPRGIGHLLCLLATTEI